MIAKTRDFRAVLTSIAGASHVKQRHVQAGRAYSAANAPAYSQIKARQQVTWTSGDFAVIGSACRSGEEAARTAQHQPRRRARAAPRRARAGGPRRGLARAARRGGGPGAADGSSPADSDPGHDLGGASPPHRKPATNARGRPGGKTAWRARPGSRQPSVIGRHLPPPTA